MNRNLGILSSLMTLAVTIMLFSGCSDFRLDNCDPICQESPCHEEHECYTVNETNSHHFSKYPSRNELHCIDGVIVRAKSPETCSVGNQYSLEFTVEACEDVCDVEVSTTLPEGVNYKKSEPTADMNGRKLTWNFGSMKCGESHPAVVWLECEAEGELCTCFCAHATPVRFCSLVCAKPILSCCKSGPEEVSPCESITYMIAVTNTGTGTAHDVIVTDNVPAGLEHSSGQRTLTYRLCDIAPCETKHIEVNLKPTRRGEFCNTAVVTACDADSVSCKACTCVCICNVEVEKTGPEEIQIGKNADYHITVTNTGDKNLTNVVVTDIAPCETTIVAANGACIEGNYAYWTIKEMKPGEKVSYVVTLTTCAPGCHNNYVEVSTCEGCSASSCVTTYWKGKPAYNMCIYDTCDPICVGENTTYSITVVNQGNETDDDVRVVVYFPQEVTPISASGDSSGTISDNTVTFTPVHNFSPGRTLKLWVQGRAAKSGDGRVVVELTSQSIQTPIVQQESTNVN
jgi:uncharacterized repeat protein (TIGR01451 family)